MRTDTHTHPCAGMDADVLLSIAEELGTPTYVYDAAQLNADASRWIRAAGGGQDVFYSVKANSNLSVLRRLAARDVGCEVATRGELHRALQAGLAPARIVFGGVPKDESAIGAAIDAGIDLLVLQAEHEVEETLTRADPAREIRVGLRVRPGIRAGAHPSLETARQDTKFGFTPGEIPVMWTRLSGQTGVQPLALAVHLGSGLDRLEPYSAALDVLLPLAEELGRVGAPVTEIDIGGGLGVDYADGTAADPAELTRLVGERLAGHGLRVRYEPGRSVVARAGVLLTRVLYRRDGGGKAVLVCDAGFTDFSRYALYGMQHRIEPLNGHLSGPPTVDVHGPTCETGDVLGTGRALHDTQPGDYLVLRDAGAYGFTMASNYNSRPRPAEAMVDAGSWSVIRTRESTRDLWRGEHEQDQSSYGDGR